MSVHLCLQQTINICADVLSSSLSRISEVVFIELKEFTMSAEFNFNKIMYRQIDGIAMGSPLGPTIANILVFDGFFEQALLSGIARIMLDYMYDTFCVF